MLFLYTTAVLLLLLYIIIILLLCIIICINYYPPAFVVGLINIKFKFRRLKKNIKKEEDDKTLFLIL